MAHKSTSRRQFLAASGAAFASLWLAADPEEIRKSLHHAMQAARSDRPTALEWLTPEQAVDVEAIAEQIFPTDETPGAREARVVNFIDHALATWASERRDGFTKGLAELNAQVAKRWPEAGRFARLTPDRQHKLLRSRQKTAFFRDMRDVTITAMFAMPSWGGNQDKIGWRHLGFDDRFAWQPPFGDYEPRSTAGGGN